MNKFKEGDMVQIIGGSGTGDWRNFESCKGKIAKITGKSLGQYHLNDNQWMINFKEEWLKKVDKDDISVKYAESEVK